MKKMITTILNRIFGADASREKEMIMAGKVEVNVEKQQEKIERYDDPDLNTLAERYGELKLGKVITIELNEAARLLGRKRVRLDAFSGLIKKLHNDYGVELMIYSRRTKLNERKD